MRSCCLKPYYYYRIYSSPFCMVQPIKSNMFRLVRARYFHKHHCFNIDQGDAPSGCSEYQSCHILSRSLRTFTFNLVGDYWGQFVKLHRMRFPHPLPLILDGANFSRALFVAAHHHLQEEIIELTGKDLKLRVDLSPGNLKVTKLMWFGAWGDRWMYVFYSFFWGGVLCTPARHVHLWASSGRRGRMPQCFQ